MSVFARVLSTLKARPILYVSNILIVGLWWASTNEGCSRASIRRLSQSHVNVNVNVKEYALQQNQRCP